MYRFNKAFTLIELLVVMVILSLSLALVIPLSIKQVDSAKQRAEREKVVLIIQNSIRSSFFKTSLASIEFTGKQLVVDWGNSTDTVELTYMFFENAKLHVTPSGVQPRVLKANIMDINWQLGVDNEKVEWSKPD